LQRVGDQYSGTNQKLIQAVMEVAQAILTALPPIPTGYNGMELPRGYSLVRLDPNIGNGLGKGLGCQVKRSRFVMYAVDAEWQKAVELRWSRLEDICAPKEVINTEKSRFLPNLDLKLARKFADDVAAGLVDEIHSCLDKHNRKNEAQIQLLEKAKENISRK
jgi:hypothetical protein